MTWRLWPWELELDMALPPRHVMEVEEHFDDQSLGAFSMAFSKGWTAAPWGLPPWAILRCPAFWRNRDLPSWRSHRCGSSSNRKRSEEITRDQRVYNTQEHRYVYKYIYIYIYTSVCVCVRHVLKVKVVSSVFSKVR